MGFILIYFMIFKKKIVEDKLKINDLVIIIIPEI